MPKKLFVLSIASIFAMEILTPLALLAQSNSPSFTIDSSPVQTTDQAKDQSDTQSSDLNMGNGTTAPSASSSPTTSSIKPVQSNITITKPAAPAASAAIRKPTKLYGRIEELCATSGARIPLKLYSQKPIMDTSMNSHLRSGASTSTLQGSAMTMGTVAKSFPMDWSGSWSGQLTIYTAQFDRIRWEFDPEEASKEVALLKPGITGSVTFQFQNDSWGRMTLEPAQVMFTAKADANQSRQMLNQMFGSGEQAQAMQQLFGNANMGSMMSNIPYMYAMHLGNLSQGRGVTGNQLDSRIVKNELKQLGPETMEQTVITYDTDHNARTGKTRHGYSESVLRFTKLSYSQLYVQAATVNYRQDGRFENKVVLYGKVNRGQGGYSSGYPSSGGADANSLQGITDMLQKMLGQ